VKKKPILISLLVLFLIWTIAALAVRKALLPPPWEVIKAFFIDLPNGLGRHILVSTWRVLISIVVAAAAGIPLGLWLGQERQADKYLYPLIYVLYPIPKITLLPIIILFWELAI